MTNPYYTHRKYLQQELYSLSQIALSKPINILELGVGDGSSELLHNFAKQNSTATILGLESDTIWSSLIQNKYELPNYKIKHINNWDVETYKKIIMNQFYDLVFIDQSPWSARIESLEYLSANHQFETVILHDYDYYNTEDNKYCYDHRSFFKDYCLKYTLNGYFEILPPTLIIKNKI